MKQEPLYTVVGDVNYVTIRESYMEITLKTKNRSTI
jgi:hypothetical protein